MKRKLIKNENSESEKKLKVSHEFKNSNNRLIVEALPPQPPHSHKHSHHTISNSSSSSLSQVPASSSSEIYLSDLAQQSSDTNSNGIEKERNKRKHSIDDRQNSHHHTRRGASTRSINTPASLSSLQVKSSDNDDFEDPNFFSKPFDPSSQDQLFHKHEQGQKEQAEGYGSSSSSVRPFTRTCSKSSSTNSGAGPAATIGFKPFQESLVNKRRFHAPISTASADPQLPSHLRILKRSVNPKLKIISSDHSSGPTSVGLESQPRTTADPNPPPRNSSPHYSSAHFASDSLPSLAHDSYVPTRQRDRGGANSLPWLVWVGSKYNQAMTALLMLCFVWMIHLEYLGEGLQSIDVSSEDISPTTFFGNLTAHGEALLAGCIVFLTTVLATSHFRALRRRKRRWNQLLTNLLFETRNLLRFQHFDSFYPSQFIREDLKEMVTLQLQPQLRDSLTAEFLLRSDGLLDGSAFQRLWAVVEKEIVKDARIQVTEVAAEDERRICWKFAASDPDLSKEPMTTSSSSPSSSSSPPSFSSSSEDVLRKQKPLSCN